MTTPADRDREQPQTVVDIINQELDLGYRGRGICARLGLRYDTVLDGPIVVLHPGDIVVRPDGLCVARTSKADFHHLGCIVVASNLGVEG